MKKLLYIFVMASLIYAIYSTLTYSMPKVSSLDQIKNFIGREVQVQGKVVPNSFEIRNNTITFLLTDGKTTIKVYYELKNMYIPSGSEEVLAIVRGRVVSGYEIYAKEVLISCPSKYEVKMY